MGTGYGYFYYMIAMMVLGLVSQNPWLLIPIGLIFLARRWIPDPWVFVRTFGRISALSRQIEANPSNVTARRDLAMIYMDRMRPGRAAELVADARKRFPDDAELLFLAGLAAYRQGKYQEALDPLVQSVERDPRLRFGEPYLLAGDALFELGRFDEAIDAYDRYLSTSTSSIEGLVKKARAHRRAGEAEAAKKDLDEAVRTWGQIPGFQRRRQFPWWIRAHVARLLG
ncbi:MAG: tetratricopeptide repeat protein [Sandaracinus sp.]